MRRSCTRVTTSNPNPSLELANAVHGKCEPSSHLIPPWSAPARWRNSLYFQRTFSLSQSLRRLRLYRRWDEYPTIGKVFWRNTRLVTKGRYVPQVPCDRQTLYSKRSMHNNRVGLDVLRCTAKPLMFQHTTRQGASPVRLWSDRHRAVSYSRLYIHMVIDEVIATGNPSLLRKRPILHTAHIPYGRSCAPCFNERLLGFDVNAGTPGMVSRRYCNCVIWGRSNINLCESTALLARHALCDVRCSVIS